jgi:tetratricopeptide (TPR) repeat protein
MLLLAKTEQHLGNNDAAEAVLHSALALADPSRDDALLPYVAMSELLSARGRLGEARDILDEARKKLPPSATIERAFGEVSELQGDYDGAIAHYKAALERDPRDVVAHFKLGVALRRVRRFDDASGELDQVAAVDKEYPGLSLERGLLFEESGDVQKAIELFKRPTTQTCSFAWGARTWPSIAPTTPCRCCRRS